MSVKNVEKRHFFTFPKEYDRWLQWIQASKRMDLQSKGPQYANRNCVMCHFHFEEKWLKKTTVLRLHPDAIPTIFFGPAFDKENIHTEMESVPETKFPVTEENETSDVQCPEHVIKDTDAIATRNLQTEMKSMAQTEV